MKLNQVIAIEKGIKGDANEQLTLAYQNLAKAPLLSGIARKYEPKDEDGDSLPPESTKVQLNADDALRHVASILARMFDITVTKDTANQFAHSDIVVTEEGIETVIATRVPVSTLLFLEKQLIDLKTFVRKLPTLDPSEDWAHDPNTNLYRSAPVQTVRTKKIPRNHVRVAATDKHPAQVDVYHEDVVMGYWTTTKFSGALPAQRVAELVRKVSLLQEAVKQAREAANVYTVDEVRIGQAVFSFLGW